MKRLEALEKIRKGYKLCLDAEAGNYYLFEKVEINKRNEIIKVENGEIIKHDLAIFILSNNIIALNL